MPHPVGKSETCIPVTAHQCQTLDGPILPLPKLEEVSWASLLPCWKRWIQKWRGQIPQYPPPLLLLPVSSPGKAHPQGVTMTFPWNEREYSPPSHMGGKEECSAPEAWPETHKGKSSHCWAKLVYGRERSRWVLYPSLQHHAAFFVPLSHYHTTPLSDEGYSCSWDGYGHRQDSQKVEPAELKSKPSFHISFLV